MATNAKNLAELLNTDTTVAVGDIADGSVTSAKLAASAVTTAKVADDAVTTAKVANTVNLGRRNLIINGEFQCWQRGNSITSNNSNKYTADRWHSGTNGSENVVYSRQFTNTSDGTPYMRVRRAGTASGRMYLTQMMETSVLDFCRGKTVTLSFQARKHADFDATFVSRIATQTNQSPRDDTVVQNNDVTRTLTTSFQTFTQSLTLTSSSNSANGFRVEFVVEDGANSSSNYYYEVRDVQLEIGSVATPIEHRSFAEELQLCKRYYQEYQACAQEWIYVEGNGAAYKWWQNPIKVPMRATPTTTHTGFTGASFAGSTVSTLTRQGISANRVSWRVTLAGAAGGAYEIRHTDQFDQDKIHMDAEL